MSKMTCSDEYGMLNMCKKYTTHSKYVRTTNTIDNTFQCTTNYIGNDAHWAEPLIKSTVWHNSKILRQKCSHFRKLCIYLLECVRKKLKVYMSISTLKYDGIYDFKHFL